MSHYTHNIKWKTNWYARNIYIAIFFKCEKNRSLLACFFYYYSKHQSYQLQAIFGIHQSIIIIHSNYNYQLDRYNSLEDRLSSFDFIRQFWVIFGYFLLFFYRSKASISPHNTNIKMKYQIYAVKCIHIDMEQTIWSTKHN